MDATTLEPGTWRFEQLADLPDDGRRYEVVDGLLVVSPPPSQLHQLVVSGLAQQLFEQAPPHWRVVTEFPLPLGTDGRVPDLSVVAAEVTAAAGGAGAPYPIGPQHFGLVVEVVSPSSRKTDRFAKPGEYAEAGIPLFWRVELEPSAAVHAFVLADGRYLGAAVVASPGGTCPAPWGPVTLDLQRLIC